LAAETESAEKELVVRRDETWEECLDILREVLGPPWYNDVIQLCLPSSWPMEGRALYVLLAKHCLQGDCVQSAEQIGQEVTIGIRSGMREEGAVGDGT
jgi:hypothetical protein